MSVYFPHPEWGRNTARYSTDTRPLPAEGVTWTFEVITHTPAPVTLHFEGLETVPPDLAIRLVDDALQTWQDLRQMNRYVVAGAGEGTPKRLKLVVGTPAFLDDALEAVHLAEVHYELFQNYPNPFNPVTTIRYSLPAPEKVSLVVYNVLGEQVATLIREAKQAAGYHVVVWDGRNDAGMEVASGVYFLRMRAGAFVATRTLALIK